MEPLASTGQSTSTSRPSTGGINRRSDFPGTRHLGRRASWLSTSIALLALVTIWLVPGYSYAAVVSCVEGVEPTPFAYGDNTADCAIDVGTDTDSFTFSGEAGDEIVLNLRTLTNGLDPRLGLRGPDGIEFAANACTGSNNFGTAVTCGFALNATLETTGTYTVIVGETGLNEAGNYNLELHRLFPPIAPTPLEFDVVVTDNLNPGTDINFYQFAANSGDEIVLNLRTLTNGLDPRLGLRGPDGIEFAANACTGSNNFGTAVTCGFALNATLEAMGTYTVIVGETGLNEAGNYNLELHRLFPPIAPTPLEFDVVVTDNLNPGTDINFYQFAANSGDEIVLNLRTLTNGLDPRLGLRGPDGIEFAANACTGSNNFGTAVTCGFALNATLETTGTYTVIVGETGLNEAGNYNLELHRLFPPIAPTPLEFDVVVTDNLNPGTDINFYQFAANSGDEIVINLRTLTNGLDPRLGLRGPDGIEFAADACTGSNNFGTAVTCGFALNATLEAMGTYTVIVGETGLNEAGNYNLELHRLFPPIAPTPLEFDVVVTDNLNPGTDINFYQFAANSGDEIVLNLRTLTNGLDPRLGLRGPDGIEFAADACTGSNNFGTAVTCGFALNATLETTGTYTVIVGETGLNEAGNYNLELHRLFPPIAPTPLEFDVVVTDNLNPGTDINFYQFAANSGDEIVINLRTLTNGLDPRLGLRGPDGIEFAADACTGSNNFGTAVTCGFALNATLETTGTYTVIVGESGLNESGSYVITLECLTGDCGVQNVPPVIEPIPDMENDEGESPTNQVVATDADDDPLTYEAPGLPDGLTIDPDTGLISGFLDFASAGIYLDIVVTVSDGENIVSSNPFDWTVNEGNEPPPIEPIADQLNIEGDQVSLQVIATDNDGDILSYSAVGLPPGLTIDPDSGLISGLLDFNSAGVYVDIVVTVSDGPNSVGSDPFSWTVNDAPPPVPEANPVSLNFGEVIIGASGFASTLVTNSGGSVLRITEITTDNAAFEVLPPAKLELAPGASASVNVAFTPSVAGAVNGNLVMVNNSGIDLVAQLAGQGISEPGTGDIDVVDSLDFGEVEENSRVERALAVSNVGDGLLTITDAITSDGAFSVDTQPGESLPMSLNPGETRSLLVGFEPPAGSAGTTLDATLTILSDDVDEPARLVALAGNVFAEQTGGNNTVLAARVTANLIDALSCSNVSGEVLFSSDSSAADQFRVQLVHQNGDAIVGSFLGANEGAGGVAFSGIDACGLADGIVAVQVNLERDGFLVGTFDGTPAVKNTGGALAAPVLDPVPVFTLDSTVEICGSARSSTTVMIEGGAKTVALSLDGASSDFCLDVPLRRNTQNTLIVSAIDAIGPPPLAVASAAPLQIAQIDLASIVIADAFSRPLTVDEIEALVARGVIDTDDPANFNISMFTIVLTIGSYPVTISQPVVGVPGPPGTVRYGLGGSGGSGGGSGGWLPGPGPTPGGGGCTRSCAQLFVVTTGGGQTVPGVIIIDGRIKTLKEFFQVGLALYNNSTAFNLLGMSARVDVPGGLTPIGAGLGLDLDDINQSGALDEATIGDIAPGETGVAQFLLRGDGIGTHRIDVDFDGDIGGGLLPAPIPVAGSARTSVRVLGPPKLKVVVAFPSDPDGPDVQLGEVYTLTVDITNVSDRPALYTSLELFVGGDAVLVNADGDDILLSRHEASFGTILPGQTQSVSVRVKSLAEGEIIACQAVASENIILTVNTGPEGAACNILNTIPADFRPLPPQSPPTVIAINPLNGEPNIPLTSSVFAVFTPETSCLVADSWANVVTTNINPADPGKGLRVVTADLVQPGSFYLEELDDNGDPVRRVPVDLTVVSPPAGGTTIAVMRLGLDAPHANSQFFLSKDTQYRATIVGGPGGVCSVGSGLEMANTFRWRFSTAESCNLLEPPSVTMLDPPDRSIDRPLDQQILLEFTNRNKDSGADFAATMDPASFDFDAADFDASTFGVYVNALEKDGDITGGSPVAGDWQFEADNSRLRFVPAAGALSAGDIIHVRVTDRLNDVCANPVLTPPNGVKLLFFDLEEAAAPAVCDVDLDGDVDRDDVILISLARNQPANGPDDPRDYDRNGRIDLLDARGCQLACTLPRCQVP